MVVDTFSGNKVNRSVETLRHWNGSRAISVVWDDVRSMWIEGRRHGLLTAESTDRPSAAIWGGVFSSDFP